MYDDVTYVYDDVTYVYDDVTYVQQKEAAKVTITHETHRQRLFWNPFSSFVSVFLD
jgi:hypothetical protein